MNTSSNNEKGGASWNSGIVCEDQGGAGLDGKMLLMSKSDKSDDGDGPTVDVASFWDSNDAEATNNADVQVAVFEDTGYVANFTLPTLKIFLEARSQNVYCNQQ